VFMPSNWWHGVLNLDDTLAINQDFLSRANFDIVWKNFRKERKKLACVFLRKLKKFHPDLYERALHLNEEDGFIMHDKRHRAHKTPSNTMTIEEAHPVYNSDSDISKSPETSDTSYTHSDREEFDFE
jgi:histone arginine demethylase JMJD6